MGLISDIQEAHGIKLVKALNADRVQQLISASGYGSDIIGEDSYTDQRKLSSFYEKIVWVHRCVSMISANLAQLPLKVIRVLKNGDETDVSEQRMFRILQKPNAWQTKFDFYMESYSRLELQGELFWELQRGNLGNLEAMYADWRSEEIQIIGDPEAYIAKFIRNINGKLYKFDPSDVFYLKYFNPSSNLRGMSPLKPAGDASNLDIQAVEFNKTFFKSGMKLAGILETEDELAPSEARRIKKKFAEMYAGTDQMHQVAVTHGGLKFTPMNSMTLAEAQFQELRQMNKEEIAGNYGIPLVLLTIGDATYENVKYARRMFWTETLQPKMKKILEILNRFYLPNITKDPVYKIVTSYNDVEALKEDKSTKMKLYDLGAKNRAITPNEIRQDVFNKEPFDDPIFDEPIDDPVTAPAIDDKSKKKLLKEG